MNAFSLGFTSAYDDPVTGSYPLGNGYRWYLPSLMRFNAPDSLSPFDSGGIHPYAYCAADPINYWDPSGHMFKSLEPMLAAIAEKVRARRQITQANASIAAIQATLDPNDWKLGPEDVEMIRRFHGNASPSPPHSPTNLGELHAGDHATASHFDPDGPPAKRVKIDNSETGGPRQASPSDPAQGAPVEAGPARSLRFQDWYDRASQNPLSLPGSGRQNPNLNVLYSLASDLDSHGLTFASLQGDYTLTLARMLKLNDLNKRIYNEYWGADNIDRKDAFRLIARVFNSPLPSD